MDRMDRMETLFSACKKSRQAAPAKALRGSQQAKKEGAEKIFFRTLSGMAINRTVKAYVSKVLWDIPAVFTSSSGAFPGPRPGPAAAPAPAGP
ncbi:hypothetical protein [Desulfovibrio piger]